MDSADTGLHIIKVYEENRSFLPLNLTVSEDGVEPVSYTHLRTAWQPA